MLWGLWVCLLALCMDVFSWMYVCIPHNLQCLERPEEDIGFPETGVSDSCKPPCVCWESNPGSLERRAASTCNC